MSRLTVWPLKSSDSRDYPGPSYALAMDPAWYLPTALAVLFAACIVMGLIGADSRPGFSNGRTDVKERWYFHSRDDYL